MITCHAYEKESFMHYHMYAYTAIAHNKESIPLESDDGLLQRIHKDQLSTITLTDFTEMICKKIMDTSFPRFA